MYTLVPGLYPLAAIVVCALFTLIYFSVVRLKCSAHWAIGFIFTTMIVTTVVSLVSPMRWVELDTAVELLVEPEETSVSPISVVGMADEPTPSLKVKAQQPLATGSPTIRPFLHNVSHLFGWLWLTGCCLMLLHLVWQLSRLFMLRRQKDLVGHQSHVRLYSTDDTEAYSFGRNVFIPRNFDEEMRCFMTLHELAHVKRHHFLWLCVFQVLLAVNWYNPFCWLLLREMRLQQELQVDGDVIRQGVDRTAYQYSLLRASMLGGGPVWILSAFGRKPVTHRVAFMNSDINARSNVRRAVVSSLLAIMVLSMTIVVACQNNEKRREHQLMGWWTLDLVKNTGSNTEVYLPFRQIGFRNYDTFFTIHYHARDGKALSFGFSFSESRLKGDTLVDADGNPERYHFISDNTVEVKWTRKPYQMALMKGPEITDQWSRMPVDEDLRNLFEIMVHADNTHQSHSSHHLNGVWKSEHDSQRYLLVSDTLFMLFHIAPQQGTRTFHGGGDAFCGKLKLPKKNWLQFHAEAPVQYRLVNANHLVLDGSKHYTRISMPYAVRRLLATPLTYEQIDYGKPEALLRTEDMKPPTKESVDTMSIRQ